jgi:hypothetical protein
MIAFTSVPREGRAAQLFYAISVLLLLLLCCSAVLLLFCYRSAAVVLCCCFPSPERPFPVRSSPMSELQ